MNRRGFTLVELLVATGLIAVMLAVGTVNVHHRDTGLLRRSSRFGCEGWKAQR